MKLFDDEIVKLVSKRKIKENSLSDIAILLDTISKLQGGRIIPKGVYKFLSFKEADEWAMKMIADIHERHD